jgi:hypothetical protein
LARSNQVLSAAYGLLLHHVWLLWWLSGATFAPHSQTCPQTTHARITPTHTPHPTQQEQRLTEAELESRFSVSLLPKTLVFTQEDLLGLLEVRALFVCMCMHCVRVVLVQGVQGRCVSACMHACMHRRRHTHTHTSINTLTIDTPSHTRLAHTPCTQSNDAPFKRMLGAVVDTECWEAARKAAADHTSSLTSRQDSSAGVRASLCQRVGRLATEVQELQEREQEWQQQAEAAQARCVSRDARRADCLLRRSLPCRATFKFAV